MTVTRIIFSILILICSAGFVARAQPASEKTLSLEEVNAIIRQLTSGESIEQRPALNVLTLFAAEADRLIEVIPKQLEDQSPEKRIEALQALDKFSRKALVAVPALLEIVDSEDRELRWVAVQLLEPIVILGIQTGPGVFAALYEREQREVRETAEILLKTLHMAQYRTIVDSLSFLRESTHPIKTILAQALEAYDDFLATSWTKLREEVRGSSVDKLHKRVAAVLEAFLEVTYIRLPPLIQSLKKQEVVESEAPDSLPQPIVERAETKHLINKSWQWKGNDEEWVNALKSLEKKGITLDELAKALGDLLLDKEFQPKAPVLEVLVQLGKAAKPAEPALLSYVQELSYDPWIFKSVLELLRTLEVNVDLLANALSQPLANRALEPAKVTDTLKKLQDLRAAVRDNESQVHQIEGVLARSVDMLIDRLKQPALYDVVETLQQLEFLGRPAARAAPLVIPFLSGDARVREASRRWLERWEIRSEVRAFFKENKEAIYQVEAALALFVDVLRKKLEQPRPSDIDDDLKLLGLLRDIGEPEARVLAPIVDMLIDRLKQPALYDVVETLQQLEFLGRPAARAAPLVIPFLSGDARVREASRRWLERWEIRSEVRAFLSANTPETEQAKQALATYVIGGSAEAGIITLLQDVSLDWAPIVAALSQQLAQPESAALGETIRKLQYIGEPAVQTAPRVVQLLRSPQKEVSLASGLALKSFGPAAQDHVEALQEALRAAHPHVREAAAIAMSGLGERGAPAVDILLEALRDTGSEADLVYFLDALAAIGRPAAKAAPQLAKLIETTPTAAYQAAHALERIGPDAHAAVPILLRVLQDPKHPSRDTAVGVLETFVQVTSTEVLHQQMPLDELAKALGDLLLDKEFQPKAPVLEVLVQLGKAAKPAEPALLSYVQELSYDPWIFKSVLELLRTLEVNVDLLANALSQPLANRALEPAKVTDTLKKLQDLRAAVRDNESQVHQIEGVLARSVDMLIDRLKQPALYDVVETLQQLEFLGRPAARAAPLVIPFLSGDARVREASRRWLERWEIRSEVRAFLSANTPETEQAKQALATYVIGGSAEAGIITLLQDVSLDWAPIVAALSQQLAQPESAALGETIRKLQYIGEPAVQTAPRVVQLLRSPQKEVSLASGLALKSFGPAAQDHVEALQEALRAAHPHVREAAAIAMSGLGERGAPAVDILLEALRDTGSEADLVYFLDALAAIGRPAAKAAPQLAKLIETTPTAAYQAAHALERIGPDAHAAVPILLRVLQDPKHPSRDTAVGVLGAVGHKRQEVAKILLQVLQSDEVNLRVTALRSLGHIGFTNTTILNQLQKSLISDEQGECNAALDVIASLGAQAERTVPTLLKILKDPTHPSRLRVAKVLGTVAQGREAVALALLQAFESDEVDLKATVLRSLGSIGLINTAILNQLQKSLISGEQAESRAALDVIKSLDLQTTENAHRIIDALVDIFPQSDRELQREIISTIGNTRRPTARAVNLLIEVWQSQSKHSYEARNSFSHLGVQAIEALTPLIQSAREEQTQNARRDELRYRLELTSTAQQLAENLLDDVKKADLDELKIQKAKLKTLHEAVSALGEKDKGPASWFGVQDVQSAKKRIEGVSQAIENEIRIRMVPDPWWHLGLKAGAAILSANFILVLMAIWVPRVRRVMLHPLGSAMLGLVVGKYLFTDLLIRFVPFIRMGLFRDYRRKLEARAIKDWENRLYVPPEVSLLEETHPPQDNEQWKYAFEALLRQPKGRLWLLHGKSGLGKTALLEKWQQHALLLKKTPIFVPLSSDLSPKEWAAAVMAQHGDIDVKSEVALDLLKDGGFVILLDGFNEDRTPDVTREFVRQLSKRNHVVMSSQVDPKWESVVETHQIQLKPFGRAQLLQLLEASWVDKLLASEYLADLAQLPQTAQLLADYITKNDKLPALRLDIYRHLRRNFEQDTQILNLEETAWNLFKENKKPFKPDDRVSKELCDLAVVDGILTRTGDSYQFRHERIHRFFVACYLHRQAQDRWRPLAEWYGEVKGGLGQDYWSDTLELWGEIYAEAARESSVIRPYYRFLEETVQFSPQIFAERLYPQLQRLYQTQTLEEDPKFSRRVTDFLALAVAAA